MNSFRVKDNVPYIYTKESRDFQLLCNVFDLMNNGVKFDIDSIKSLSSADFCRDNILPYLQHKLGLFLNMQVTDDILRPILKCFPYIVRKKGSKEGIIETICLFLTTMKSDGKYTIGVRNNPDGVSGLYVIDIGAEAKMYNVQLLDQLLKYILPPGYDIEYHKYVSKDFPKLAATRSGVVSVYIVGEGVGSVVRGNECNYDTIVGSVGTTTYRSIKDTATSDFNSYEKKVINE